MTLRAQRRYARVNRNLAHALLGSAVVVTAVYTGTSVAPSARAAGPVVESVDAATPMSRSAQRALVERTLLDERIRESSGLARSTRFSGVALTHNDSGDTARVFAVGATGVTKAVWTLGGATSRDWEDMAIGPNHKVWVGDIGDNFSRRQSIHVYSFTEPRQLASASVAATHYELRYPNGPHNAETLLVNRRTSRVMIVTKNRSGGAFYRAPLDLRPDRVTTLKRVRGAPAVVTGGAAAPGGTRLVLRTPGTAYVYARLGASPRTTRLPESGESVTWTAGGDALLTGSEGLRSDVWRVSLD